MVGRSGYSVPAISFRPFRSGHFVPRDHDWLL